jgi:5-methylcytosine-specific restriction protein A
LQPRGVVPRFCKFKSRRHGFRALIYHPILASGVGLLLPDCDSLSQAISPACCSRFSGPLGLQSWCFLLSARDSPGGLLKKGFLREAPLRGLPCRGSSQGAYIRPIEGLYMAWRREALPEGWFHIRKQVLLRDAHRCTWFPGGSVQGWDYKDSYTHPYRCSNKATDVDHINDRSNHSMSNLRSLCKEHHSSKTSSFAHSEINRRNKMMSRRNAGKSGKHPGLL